jgi:ATP-dependent helicase HepA
LFRRGNPFIDGIEAVLALDDRGQASALWRLDPKWKNEPLVYFGFDFVVEANPNHILDVLDGDIEMRPIAVRRADSALPPFQHRVWIPVNSLEAVVSSDDLRFLNAKFHNEGRDVNLNLQRISALYNVLGGETNLSPIAIDCASAARQQLDALTDLEKRCGAARRRIQRETDGLVAQSRARRSAAGLVADPLALEKEVDIGRALEAGVLSPHVSVSSVTCVVRASEPWGIHA